MTGAPGPLTGVRVLDVTRFLAGPYATMILAELGADVIKLEDPARPDEARSVGPYFQNEYSLYFAALNAGKKSVALSLSKPDGQNAARALAATCDVVLDNNKPGAMLQNVGSDFIPPRPGITLWNPLSSMGCRMRVLQPRRGLPNRRGRNRSPATTSKRIEINYPAGSPRNNNQRNHNRFQHEESVG